MAPSPHILAVAVAILLSGVGVLADYFLKLASGAERPLYSIYFTIGLVVYSSTAFGWVYVMQHVKLAHIGVYYSLATLLLLVAIGVGIFGERLRPTEYVGIALAVASILLLARVA